VSAQLWHHVQQYVQQYDMLHALACAAVTIQNKWMGPCACSCSRVCLILGLIRRGVNTGLLDPVTAEKQISLLTKGLAHHPSSTRLLLALLRCYASVAPDADALEAKWAGVLSRQGGSWELWREYIALRWADRAAALAC
jgi:hypothetical protein